MTDLGFKFGPEIEQAMRNLWADNGDFISVQYSGTESVISEVTRKGTEGFMSKLFHVKCTINRFFKNWLDDDFRQKAIDVLLSKDPLAIPGKG